MTIATTGPLERTLFLSDGQPIHCTAQGSGVPLLFVHGLPGLGSNFQPLVVRLNKQAHCIVVDRAGYGRSTPLLPNRPMTVDQAVKDLTEIVAQLELQKVVLVGWSYGGHLVCELAARAPECVASVVLLGTAGPTLNLSAKLADRLLYHPSLGPLLLKILKRLAPAVLRQGLNDAVGQAVTDQLFESFLDGLDQPGAIDNWIREAVNWAPESMRPQDVSQPVLVIHGDADSRVSIEVAREVVERLPQVECCELVGAGHWPFLTHPEIVAERVLGFLSETEFSS